LRSKAVEQQLRRRWIDMYTSIDCGGGGWTLEKLQLEGEPLVAGELGLRGDTADAVAELSPGLRAR
jgi:hypothetical protein